MKKHWWMEAVVYEIYPRSFNDSNGDGIGDIRGIIDKLDYLHDLGVTAIWICPFYKSPMDDNGYDVSDFYEVSRDYGDLRDIKHLHKELKKRDMKLIVDLVLNHTSDEHPWFIEARKSKDSVFRDYYIWQDGKDGREPTNWESFFGGSVWELDKETDQYYLKLFSKKMPDLNWQNETVRKEMYEIAEFWIEHGADGFRVDAVAHIEKDQKFPNVYNNTSRKYVPAYQHYANLPKVHDYVREFNDKVLSKYDVMTVGEAGGANHEEAVKYAGFDRKEFNMLLAFDHCWIDENPNGIVPSKWTQRDLHLPWLKNALARWQSLHGQAWNTLYWSNHDQPRVVSHYGNDSNRWRNLSAKSLAVALYFMYGTPFVYQGEEIGMTNVAFDSIYDYNDVEIYTFYKNAIHAGISHDEAMKMIHNRSRDNARTPMQWDSSENAGFTTGKPWIKVNPNYTSINVEKDMKSRDSIYKFYQQIFKLRNEYKTFIYGKYEQWYEGHQDLYIYCRCDEDGKYLVISNFSNKHVKHEMDVDIVDVLLCNYSRPSMTLRHLVVRPYEAVVYKII
jgi:glycosidase